MPYQLAQINIVEARYPLDDERMKPFVDQLPKVNKDGENSPGFVWILKDETETAVNFVLFDNPNILVNLTVWESVDALKNFIYKGDHLKAFIRRKEWFLPMKKSHLAMWWIPVGHIPTLDEAEQKLVQLWEEGPSAAVFTFRKVFPPPLES